MNFDAGKISSILAAFNLFNQVWFEKTEPFLPLKKCLLIFMEKTSKIKTDTYDCKWITLRCLQEELGLFKKKDWTCLHLLWKRKTNKQTNKQQQIKTPTQTMKISSVKSDHLHIRFLSVSWRYFCTVVL